MRTIDGAAGHLALIKSMKQKLAFDENKDYATWKKEVREKLFDLLGMANIEANACPLNFEIESEVQKEGYKQIRFTIESEPDEFVPCYLLIPDTGKKKYPLAITMQGHSTGFHNSIGEPKEDEDKEYALERGKFAVQAVENGYAALAIEQRGMGERRPNYKSQGASMCEYTAHIALELGRTIIGERCWDISKAIDAMANFDCIDTDKILITGNSGGGTISFYAACYDERIKISAPSSAFCPYEDSIMNTYHCSCNFIPHIYEWFEMQDLSCLIAPRDFIAFNGQLDGIFPIDGTRRAYERVKKIYAKENASNKCQLIETPKGHWWCVDLIWPTLNEATKKLGW